MDTAILCTLPLSDNQYKVSFLIEHFKSIRDFVANALMRPQGVIRHRPLIQSLVEFFYGRNPVLIGTLYQQGLFRRSMIPFWLGFSYWISGFVARGLSRVKKGAFSLYCTFFRSYSAAILPPKDPYITFFYFEWLWDMVSLQHQVNPGLLFFL